MAKSTDYNDKLQNFANRVKNEPVQIPVQKVIPVEPISTPNTKGEQQLNVWISKDTMKRLKVKGAETDKSLKEMVTNALELFLGTE